jgi:hypothetical protein
MVISNSYVKLPEGNWTSNLAMGIMKVNGKDYPIYYGT